MKNRFKYILPRLIGLTVVLGVLSFLMVALFKIVLLLTVVAAIGMWVASRRFKKRLHRHTMAIPSFRDSGAFAEDTFMNVMPVSFAEKTTKATIIPVQ